MQIFNVVFLEDEIQICYSYKYSYFFLHIPLRLVAIIFITRLSRVLQGECCHICLFCNICDGKM